MSTIVLSDRTTTSALTTPLEKFASIPRMSLCEDMALFAKSVGQMLEGLERSGHVLNGLACWRSAVRETPENHQLFQQIEQAQQALLCLESSIKEEVCGPLQTQLLLLGLHVSAPAWTSVEKKQPIL